MHPRYDPSRMHRQVQYVAVDGTIFSSPEGCAEYERHTKFMNALTVYIQAKLPTVSEDTLVCMEQLWIEIFKDPKSFLPVITSAMPPAKRGRPVQRKDTEILNNLDPVEKEIIEELPPVPKLPKKRESVIRLRLDQNNWRSST
jgi:hypothetical protein